MFGLLPAIVAGLAPQQAIIQQQPQRQEQRQQKRFDPIRAFSFFGGDGVYAYPMARANSGFKINQRIQRKRGRVRRG